jgi:hypothetical protein
VIETQRRQGVEPIETYIENPIPIQPATACAFRYLGAETKILEFFLRCRCLVKLHSFDGILRPVG